ncbi:unnamed protein product, partial [Mesorhabditis spiculigera]
MAEAAEQPSSAVTSRSRTPRSPGSLASLCERASFSVVVRTSNSEDASTRAYIFVQLADSQGAITDKMRLKCSITHRKKFLRGHADLFIVVGQPHLADIATVQLWHQKRADTVDARLHHWELESVDVIEHRSQKIYHFDANCSMGKCLEKESTILLRDPKPAVKVLRKAAPPPRVPMEAVGVKKDVPENPLES